MFIDNGLIGAVGHRTDKGVSLYVRTQLTGYVDVGIELQPGFSQEDFARAWNRGEIIFDGPSLGVGDEGNLILHDNAVGTYDVVDMSYDLTPWDEESGQNMIIPCAPF